MPIPVTGSDDLLTLYTGCNRLVVVVISRLGWSLGRTIR